MPVLRGRGRLTRILYDMKILRRRLELLEVRLGRSMENMKSRGAEDGLVRSYINAIKQVKYVVYSLEILEVKLESILTLSAMGQDLIVVREVLKELSKRAGSLPEISAILDEMSDGIGDAMTEMSLRVDQQVVIARREDAKKILEEAERLVEASNRETSQLISGSSS